MQNRYLHLYSEYLSRLLFFVHVFIFPKCLPSACARASSRAHRWLMDGVIDALFNAAPNVQQAMDAQNTAVTLNDVNRTQK